MNEPRECEFAYIVGQLVGFLDCQDIQDYLLEHKVMPVEIKGLQIMLEELAKKVFYRERR